MLACSNQGFDDIARHIIAELSVGWATGTRRLTDAQAVTSYRVPSSLMAHRTPLESSNFTSRFN
jgi:hypothetical protein